MFFVPFYGWKFTAALALQFFAFFSIAVAILRAFCEIGRVTIGFPCD